MVKKYRYNPKMLKPKSYTTGNNTDTNTKHIRYDYQPNRFKITIKYNNINNNTLYIKQLETKNSRKRLYSDKDKFSKYTRESAPSFKEINPISKIKTNKGIDDKIKKLLKKIHQV